MIFFSQNVCTQPLQYKYIYSYNLPLQALKHILSVEMTGVVVCSPMLSGEAADALWYTPPPTGKKTYKQVARDKSSLVSGDVRDRVNCSVITPFSYFVVACCTFCCLSSTGELYCAPIHLHIQCMSLKADGQ